ncbi:MAG: hypothetical protein U0528_12915 [Anaerolineae bacterium]
MQPYIPHRVDEGYGLERRCTDQAGERRARLVITVDCGIRSVAEVETGNVPDSI